MISFREVTVKDAGITLQWRSSSRVNKYMLADVDHDLQAQIQWIVSSFKKNNYYHWIIESHGEPIGLINLSNFSFQNSTTSWGFYIGEETQAGLGAFVPLYFYNFLFDKLHIKRVFVQVFYHNTRVINLHLAHGYRFTPEEDEVVFKNGSQILNVALTLEKSGWNFGKYRNFRSPFPMEFWSAKPAV